MISGKTALYGVVGHPIGHSRSPAMQNAAFAQLGVDAVFVALPVEPGRLAEALRGAHALGFRGLNVTVPHKQEAVGLCRELDPVARAVGAVNTLRRAGEGWEGFNTDAPATLQLLDGAGLVRGGRVLLLGAGGVARAAAWAALSMGAELLVAARRAEAAAALCSEALAARRGEGRATPIRWDQAAAESARCDAIVNATTIGLAQHHSGELPPSRSPRGWWWSTTSTATQPSSAPRAPRRRVSSRARSSWCARGPSPSACGSASPRPRR